MSRIIWMTPNPSYVTRGCANLTWKQSTRKGILWEWKFFRKKIVVIYFKLKSRKSPSSTLLTYTNTHSRTHTNMHAHACTHTHARTHTHTLTNLFRSGNIFHSLKCNLQRETFVCAQTFHNLFNWRNVDLILIWYISLLF